MMKKKAIAFAAAILMGSNLVGCISAKKTYTDYVQAVMDCSYFCETEKYMEMTDSTQEEAEAVYQDEIDYVTELICVNNLVEMDYVSEETMEGYAALAKDIVSKVKYTVHEAEKSGDSYHITIEIQPIDFWEITYDPIQEYCDTVYNVKIEEITTEEELAALEQEYAEGVLEILSGYTSQIGYKEATNKIVEITVDEDGMYGITEQDWLDIDDLLLDMNLNT